MAREAFLVAVDLAVKPQPAAPVAQGRAPYDGNSELTEICRDRLLLRVGPIPWLGLLPLGVCDRGQVSCGGEDYADQVVDEAGGAPWSNFRFVQDVVPSPGEGNRVHLHNLAIAELLFNARNAYITEAVGLTWQQLFDTGCSLIIRRLEIDYEREVLAGVPLKVGVRAITRSRRSVTFDEVVWRVDLALPIAVAGSVHVVVRFDTPGAIELPDDVVNKFESYEGHPLVGMP